MFFNHTPFKRVGNQAIVGMALGGALIMAAASAQSALVYSNLFSFNLTNGYNPNSPLLEVTPGNFYGTTLYGGSNSSGTIFYYGTNGSFSNVFLMDTAHGTAPKAGLVLGADGNIYGTAGQGGIYTSQDPYGIGYGTIFQFTTNGSVTAVHSFSGTDGASPNALCVGTDGRLYGSTSTGGSMAANNLGYGDIYSFGTNSGFNALFFFNGTNNGANPNSALVQAGNGSFYGTTAYGGAFQSGVIFSSDTNGNTTTYDVFNMTNGVSPNSLVLASNGSLFGTTLYGSSNNCGTIFRFDMNGTLTNLFNFNGTNGKYPTAMILARDGNFYGATSQGGAYGRGTLFEFDTNGVFTTIYSFTTNSDGYSPAALMQARDGSIYGSTSYGGTYGYGTLFKLATAPVVVPAPTLTISGTNSGVAFTWNALAGHTYEVQYKTNLTATNWINLQAVTATNSVATYFDPAATNRQRFYRLSVIN